ncbi:DUF1513 domain-containing protein [Vibrio sonorensis]|uniref:DUF1513 domain-containing protein n=1 Tax=Vibrio sonorensis TaxID=1004316 RepID=UPI0015863ED4|nr:DUF1513 domain-containing protein [Vibrio sonorensis]
MQPMVTDQTRRRLLKAALFSLSAPTSFAVSASKKHSSEQASAGLIGCSIQGRDRFSVVVADRLGMPLRHVVLPERGHGVAINSVLGHAVAFARRPGRFMLVFNYHTGKTIRLSPASHGRHYYGHGAYSNDGNWLYATEGEVGTSRGIIGVYDVSKGYQKVTEFSGFGLGPHEVIVMPDNTLAIGVGGVHTDGRKPLNIDAMKPSLSYLNDSGELVDQVTLADKKLSIRHLAHDGGNTVLCGQQYRGEPDDYPSLLAMHTKGSTLKLLQAEPEQWARFKHYIASIAASDEWILATSPRGNCYGIWSKSNGRLVELNVLPDASGVVYNRDEFRLSSGSGTVTKVQDLSIKQSINTNVQWDNHWSAVI